MTAKLVYQSTALAAHVTKEDLVRLVETGHANLPLYLGPNMAAGSGCTILLNHASSDIIREALAADRRAIVDGSLVKIADHDQEKGDADR